MTLRTEVGAAGVEKLLRRDSVTTRLPMQRRWMAAVVVVAVGHAPREVEGGQWPMAEGREEEEEERERGEE